jgi:hypothetical protein
VVASAIIDYPALWPTDPLWSRKLTDMIPGALHGPISTKQERRFLVPNSLYSAGR